MALGGAHIFAWIFIFQYFYIATADTAAALSSTALTYALSQIILVLATPLGAYRIRHGISRGMALGTGSAAAAFVILGLAFTGAFPYIGWGIALFAILMGIYRALYWTPYEVAGTALSRRAEIALAFTPAVAGIVLASGLPLYALLFVGAALCVYAAFSCAQMREAHEGFAWKYRETFHQLFATENRPVLLRSMLDGIEGTALLLIWPLSVFLLFDWSYGVLGIVLTVTLLSTMVIRYVLARLGLTEMPTFVLAALAGSAWVMRLLVASPAGVVLVDTYFHAGKPESRGMDTQSHEQIAENRTYVDEITALKEMGMGLGRLLLSGIVAFVAASGSFGEAALGAFIIAGLAAVASILLARRNSVSIS